MRLVEITLDYPYTEGEPFCRQELEVAKEHFDEVLLISMSGHFRESVTRYVPENARLIHARKSRYELWIFLKSFLRLCGYRTARELYFSRKLLKSKETPRHMLKEIFVYYYYQNLLKRVFRLAGIGEGDILYSYWLSAPAYFLAQQKQGCLKISRAHRYDCFIGESYQPFRRETVEGLDGIFSISEAGKRDMERRIVPFTRCSGSHIQVSRLGILGGRRAPDMGSKGSDEFVVVSCSSINQMKRLDLLIDALLEIKVPVRWIHIGDGILGSQIRRQAEGLKRNPLVSYEWKGYLPQREVYHFYENSHVDLFVNCSDSEGIPVSIMEAMSFGIPVVARKVGGNAEIVNNKNGILLKGQALAVELREAISAIYKMPEDDYRKLREHAYSHYQKYFMAEANYNAFFNRIKAMAKEKQNEI